MARYIIEVIEEVNDNNSLAVKILLWGLIGWWLVPVIYLIYYTLYFVYVLPFKLLINGFKDGNIIKIIFGFILLVFLVFIIYNTITNAAN